MKIDMSKSVDGDLEGFILLCSLMMCTRHDASIVRLSIRLFAKYKYRLHHVISLGRLTLAYVVGLIDYFNKYMRPEGYGLYC
jgi:hypothetical protein